jgi:cytochrome c oxidase subunit 2
VTALDTPKETSDGLWRWLLGGLAGGLAILGLLVAAYAVGYHRGRGHGHSIAAPAASAPATTTPAAPSAPPSAPVPVTTALVARGKTLYATDGCSACHSLSGAAGVGPSLKGIAGSTVTLTDSRTVTADDAYLQRSITDADAEIVKGYRAGVMPAAISGYHLGDKPDDVRALVAFIKSHA